MGSPIVTPTIRTPLLAGESGGAGRTPVRTPAPTTKDWWLYWDALTRAVNTGTALLDTMIRAGTEDEMTDEPPAPPNAIWIVTDRDNVVYQVQIVAGGPQWVYVTGTMTGSLSELPTNLAEFDTNFTFATSDTLEVYRWSGSAWVNETPGGLYQSAVGSGNVTLTGTAQVVTGAAVTLERPGRHIIRGLFDFTVQGTGDLGLAMIGSITADAVAVPGPAAVLVSPAGAAGLTGARATVPGEWPYTAAAAGVVMRLVVAKSAGATGTSICVGTNSLISATWIGP